MRAALGRLWLLSPTTCLSSERRSFGGLERGGAGSLEAASEASASPRGAELPYSGRRQKRLSSCENSAHPSSYAHLALWQKIHTVC
jgi:hypothetical protein